MVDKHYFLEMKDGEILEIQWHPYKGGTYNKSISTIIKEDKIHPKSIGFIYIDTTIFPRRQWKDVVSWWEEEW